MPQNKDLKRKIRARMAKTGESYTAARAQIVGTPSRALPPDYATIAGYTDENVLQRTQRTWPQWVEVLDDLGATEMGHKEIAAWVHSQIDDFWWAQSVTIGYERLVGRREVGQKSDGSFQASKSATLPVDAHRAHELLCEMSEDPSWLDGLSFTGATAPKSVRFRGPDGSRASIWITAKSPEKSGISVSHEGLPSQADIAASKSAWAERFNALKARISTSS